MGEQVDVRAGRLRPEEYRRNFDELHPPLDRTRRWSRRTAATSATTRPASRPARPASTSRCFIREIPTGNSGGAAKTILEANILGGMCARVCPTETLCEEACVRKAAGGQAGRRSACCSATPPTALLDARRAALRARAPPTGKRVAVVGAGPAGLACAHRLARARPRRHDLRGAGQARRPQRVRHRRLQGRRRLRPGARSTSSSAIGGIEVEHGKALGRDVYARTTCAATTTPCSSACGLGGVNALGLPARSGSTASRDAVDYIAELRQAQDLATLPVGRARRRDRRRHDRDRHRRPGQAARRRGRHHRLPPRPASR